MRAQKEQATDWIGVIEKMGPEFAARAQEHDENDSFVAENFEALKAQGVHKALIAPDMGGGGASYGDMCDILRTLAHYCGSTALAFSMHQHIVALNVWNHMHGRPGKKLLDLVTEKNFICISTGGRDWLESNGSMEKADGGFLVSAEKRFASGCLLGNVLVTSAPYEDPKEGWQVLHFPVPFAAEGVSIKEDWKTLGMRGTGSHTVVYKKVFVPEESVAVRRPRGTFHPLWNGVLANAMPIIMAPYVGVAEAAASLVRTLSQGKSADGQLPYLLGEMENALTTAQMALDGMIGINNEFDFEPLTEHANGILIRKSVATKAVMETVEKALEASSGAGFYRDTGLERLVRDAHGAQFHPLPEKKQQLFTGRIALGLDPIGDPMNSLTA